MRIRRRRALCGAVIAAVTLTTVPLTSSSSTVTAATTAAVPAAVPTPDEDPFYDPPADFESTAPGTVLRIRPVTVTGLGIPMPVRSWQILFRTTDRKGDAQATVATLMVPLLPYLGGGPRPLLSYQPATDAIAAKCAPSYTLRTGLEKELALAVPALLKGWAVVMTDYEGPEGALLDGKQAGHAVLDGIRASQRVGLGGMSAANPIGLWGYSGGGLASAWAAEMQPSYAPELEIAGVAQGGVVTNIRSLADTTDGSLSSGLLVMGAAALYHQYPELDLDAALNDQGRQAVDAVSDMCIGDAVLAYPFRQLSEFTTDPNILDRPDVLAVLAANKLGQRTPSVPIFQYHAIFDEVVPIADDDAVVAKYCSEGVTVQYYRDPASEHGSLAITGAPLALAYLNARFAGVEPPTNC